MEQKCDVPAGIHDAGLNSGSGGLVPMTLNMFISVKPWLPLVSILRGHIKLHWDCHTSQLLSCHTEFCHSLFSSSIYDYCFHTIPEWILPAPVRSGWSRAGGITRKHIAACNTLDAASRSVTIRSGSVAYTVVAFYMCEQSNVFLLVGDHHTNLEWEDLS